MLKNILFGRRTKKWKKGENFWGNGAFLWRKEGKGAWRRGAGAPERGCHWKRRVALPHPTGYLCRKRCTSSPWVIRHCGSWCYGWRGMVHGGSQGGSSRAYAYAHIICVPCFFWETGLPAGWQGLEGRGMAESPQKTEERLRLKRAGIMALFIFGIKRAGKKDGLLSKK